MSTLWCVAHRIIALEGRLQLKTREDVDLIPFIRVVCGRDTVLSGIFVATPSPPASWLYSGHNGLCLPRNVSAPPLLQSEENSKHKRFSFGRILTSQRAFEKNN